MIEHAKGILMQTRAVNAGDAYTALTTEATEQVSRLSSLGIYTSSDSGCCPLCDQPTSERVPSSLQLQSELNRASAQLQ